MATQRKDKYSAVLQESCSNGYRYEVKGRTLTEVRSNAILKFINSRWHKTADPPVIIIRENNGTLYGKVIGRIGVLKQYHDVAPYIFVWEPEGVYRHGWLIKLSGELGTTFSGYRKMKYADLVKQNYPYWR